MQPEFQYKGDSCLTLSLAVGVSKFHPYFGRPFKEYVKNAGCVHSVFLHKCKL